MFGFLMSDFLPYVLFCCVFFFFFFFKQKTAYEMRISDWSSDVCSSDLRVRAAGFGERLITDLAFLTEQRLDAHMAKADILVFPYRHIDSSGALDRKSVV